MAGLILKAPYYKPGHKTKGGESRGGMAEYIATRDGVELLRSGFGRNDAEAETPVLWPPHAKS